MGVLTKAMSRYSRKRDILFENEIVDREIYVTIVEYLEKILYYKAFQSTITMIDSSVYYSYCENMLNLLNVFKTRKIYQAFYDLLKYMAHRYNYTKLISLLEQIKSNVDSQKYTNVYPLFDKLAFIIYMPNAKLILGDLLDGGSSPSKPALLSAIAADNLESIKLLDQYDPYKMETLMCREIPQYAKEHNRILILEWFRNNEWPLPP